MEETRSLAPVILFTYNRPEHTKRTIEALAANELAAETDLYVFSDAAKKDADKGKVQEIRDYVKSVQGFRQVELTAREQNYGLAKNVIEGVTAIVNKYGKVIVLEDDLVTNRYFLLFMNDGLDRYHERTESDRNHRVLPFRGYFFPTRVSPILTRSQAQAGRGRPGATAGSISMRTATTGRIWFPIKNCAKHLIMTIPMIFTRS